jgi:hypothetical protein
METTPTASFFYQFAFGPEDALSHLPDESQAAAEQLIVDVIYEAFVTSADEDYLTARTLAVNELPRGFAWGAGQALEKYFKAFMLFRGKKVKGAPFGRHAIRALYNAVVALDPAVADIDISAHPDVKARLILIEPTQPIRLPNFIDTIERNGDPDNRYNAAGIEFDTNLVFALDSFIFGFRSLIGAPPIEFSLKSFDESILTAFRDNNPYFYPISDSENDGISQHSFKLLARVNCTTQEYLQKDSGSGVNMHVLNWLGQRMIIRPL